MEIKKALTFRASSIGDCLMGKYLLENIHVQYPQARLGLVVASRAGMIRDLFVAYPWLEVVEANRRSPKALFSLFKEFYGSDLVVTQYAGKHGGSFGLASKLAARVLAKRGGLAGFIDASSLNRYLYDTLISFEKDVAPALLEQKVLTKLGIPVTFLIPTISFSTQESVFARISVTSGNYVIVHLFAGNTGRDLSPKNKRVLIKALHERLPNLRLLVSGGEKDLAQAETVSANIPYVQVIAGDTSIQDMMHLIVSAAGVISVDTGMAHIAAQLRKPLVVIASCLGLHWWGDGQYGKEASVRIFTHQESRGHSFKEYPDCINNVDMEEVARVAAEVFNAR